MKNPFLRFITVMVIISLSTLSLFAGGKKESSAQEKEEGAKTPVTIDWVTWWGQGFEQEQIDAMLEPFHEENPDIKLNFIALPFGDAKKEMIQRHAAGNDADVISMNMPWLQDYLDMGMLEPLDDYIANDPDFPKDALVKTPMQKVDGHTWMVPQTVTYFTMIYNKAMFAEAGIEPPETWSELRAAAKALTNPDKGQYGVTLMMDASGASNGPILTVYPYLYTTGSTTVKDGKPNVNTPEMIKTLQLFKGLNDDGSILPGMFTKSGNQTTADLAAGTVAMVLAMPSEHPRIAKNAGLGDDVGVCNVPVPDQGGQHIARLHGIEISIASGSDKKEAAWKFISWTAQNDVSLEWAKTYGYIPPNNNVKDEYIEFLSDDPLAQEIYNNMLELDFVEELMMTPKSGDTWVSFTEEMQKMFLNEQTPKETAAAIQARWEKIFASAK
jgi:multiple sugar transport system substrate-binding protein